MGTCGETLGLETTRLFSGCGTTGSGSDGALSGGVYV